AGPPRVAPLVAAALEPGSSKAAVEGAVGEARRGVDVGDDRQWSHRHQVWWPRAADEELADAGERDADQADLPVLDPGLRCDGVDDVVAIGGGGEGEQGENPPRAARPPPRPATRRAPRRRAARA